MSYELRVTRGARLARGCALQRFKRFGNQRGVRRKRDEFED